MIALVVLLLILALFAWGFAGAVHLLIWIAAIALVVWIALWMIGGVAGGPRGYWRRPRGGPPVA